MGELKLNKIIHDIRLQTRKEHRSLIETINKLSVLLDKLGVDTIWGKTAWLPDSQFLNFVNIQKLTLLNSKDIIEKGLYRDAFHLIRMAFESYFVFRLISTCDKYSRTVKLRKMISDASSQETKERTVKAIEANLKKDLIKIIEKSDNELLVICRGCRVVDNEGKDTEYLLPFYYSLWNQYRPIRHYLRSKNKVSRYLEPDVLHPMKSSRH